MQKTEINTEKPQTDKALPSGVASFYVKESLLWLGFKRPSIYWGWKVDAYSYASIYKQYLEIRKFHTWLTEGWSKLSLALLLLLFLERTAKQVIPSSNQYDHI